MSINERFGKIIRVLFGGNKSAFANAIGVAPSVVDNIVGKRQGNPSFEVVEKVSALAEINLTWLITGRGDAFDFRSEEERSKPPRTTSEVEIKLLEMIAKKDETIKEQAKEIGRLEAHLESVDLLRLELEKAQNIIAQLTAGKNATTHSLAPTPAPAVP